MQCSEAFHGRHLGRHLALVVRPCRGFFDANVVDFRRARRKSKETLFFLLD